MRNSVKDEFEKVYLRYNSMVKNMPHADMRHTETKDWVKTINYVARKTFYRRQLLFTFNGFDLDDIVSISKAFSITFLGLPENRGKDKISHINMMRFISQKLSDLIVLTERKFRVCEVVSLFGIEDFKKGDTNNQAKVNRLEVKNIFGNAQKTPEEELIERKESWAGVVIGDLEGRLDLLNQEKAIAKKQNLTPSEKRSKIREINHRIKVLKQDIESYDDEDSGTDYKMSSVDKKNKLQDIFNNKTKYIDRICYHATSKHVSHDVRRAAVSMCRKLKIDHIKWVKDKIKEKPEEAPHFTF